MSFQFAVEFIAPVPDDFHPGRSRPNHILNEVQPLADVIVRHPAGKLTIRNAIMVAEFCLVIDKRNKDEATAGACDVGNVEPENSCTRPRLIATVPE